MNIKVVFVVLFQIAFYSILYAHSTNESSIKFTENKNQLPKQVLFQSNLNFGQLFIEKNRNTILFYDPKIGNGMHHNENYESLLDQNLKFHAIKMEFVNASALSYYQTDNKLDNYCNYFLGNDSSKWASNVYSYQNVIVNNIYKGINIHYYGSGTNLKYDYQILPQADVSAIKIKYTGAQKLEIKNNQLLIHTSVGIITEFLPEVYQINNDKKILIDCNYFLNGDIVSFKFPNGYDKINTLIIDPSLIFSSFTGSTADNFGFTATYDELGNAYAGGIAYSAGYPVTIGAFQSIFGGGSFPTGFDISISKFSSAGNSLLYSTYLGGSTNEQPHSLVVNNNHELYVFGRSKSNNFPVTAGAYDVTHNGLFDLIVTKFSASGSSLLASTYIGGSNNDGVNFSEDITLGDLKYNYADDARGEIILDAQSNVYIAACTISFNFPVTGGCFQPALGGLQDGCLFKLNSNLSQLVFSSYLGGNNNDAAYALSLAPQGDIIVVGGTNSSNLQTTLGVLHQSYSGGSADGFVFRINPTGTNIVAASYVGTNAYDQAYFVQTDKDNDVYIFGQTEGVYPITADVYKNLNSGQFIHKMNIDLTTTIYSTVFGTGQNKPDISPTAFLIDRCENVYCAGWGGTLFGFNNSWSKTIGLPVTPTAFQTFTNNDDLYFFVLRKNADSLAYASFFGGQFSKEHVDGGTCRFDKNGIIYQAVCGGCGGLSDMPTSEGVVSRTNNSPNCNYGMIKFRFDLTDTRAFYDFNNDTLGCAPYSVTFDNRSYGYQSIEWDFGDGTTSLDISPTHVFTHSGVYDVKLMAYNPHSCNERDTIIKKIYVTAPFTTNSIKQKTICKGNSVLLDATYNGATTYTWLPANEVLPSNDVAIVKVAPLLTSTYSVNTFFGGCSVTDIFTVTVKEPFSITPMQDKSICLGDSILLNVTNPNALAYSWNPANLITPSPSLNIVKVGPSTTRILTLSLTDNICTITDDVLIRINKNETKISPNGILKLCVDSSFILDAGNNLLNQTWNNGSSARYLNGNKKGKYSVLTTDLNGCKGSDSVQVIEVPRVIVTAFSDTLVCPNTPVKLSATGASIYNWTPSLYLNNNKDSSVISTPKFSIDYIVKGTVDKCVGYDTVSVTVMPFSKIELGNDFFARVGEDVILNAKTDSLIEWFPSNKLSCKNCLSTIYKADSTQLFYAYSANKLGCISSDSVRVFVDYDSSIYLPNCFSPNLDLTNDVYKVVSYGIVSYSMQIFNRWGELVYQWTDKEIGWDGTFKGVPAKQDVYAFTFKGLDVKNKKVAISGNITLIR